MGGELEWQRSNAAAVPADERVSSRLSAGIQ